MKILKLHSPFTETTQDPLKARFAVNEAIFADHLPDCPIEAASCLETFCDYLIDHFGLDPNVAETNVMRRAAELGNIENLLPFHGNPHYIAVSERLQKAIQAHNTFYKVANRDLVLNDKDIAKAFTAAFTHDLGHNGKGNVVNEKYVPMHLECRACELSIPALREAGMDDDWELSHKRIILPTDVNFEGMPCVKNSPAAQLMRGYDHIINGNDNVKEYNFKGPPFDTLFLDNPMIGIENSPKDIIMAALMHTSDIGVSLAYDIGMLRYQSKLYAEETGVAFIAKSEASFGFATTFEEHFRIPKGAKIAFENNLDRNIISLGVELGHLSV